MFDTYEDIFRRRAQSYQHAMAAFPRARDAEFQAMISPLPPEVAEVMDMPAGGGYLRSYLPKASRYIAVESTQLFHDLCPDDEHSRRVLSAVEAVAWPEGLVDAVVSLAGLHHAPDLNPIFHEMRRLVRPGGLVVIADVETGTVQDDFLNGYVNRHSVTGHHGKFLDGRTPALLQAAGLQVLSDQMIATPWRFKDEEDAGMFCASLFGIEGQHPLEVTAALADIVGLETQRKGCGVRWSLRRIVCQRKEF